MKIIRGVVIGILFLILDKVHTWRIPSATKKVG